MSIYNLDQLIKIEYRKETLSERYVYKPAWKFLFFKGGGYFWDNGWERKINLKDYPEIGCLPDINLNTPDSDCCSRIVFEKAYFKLLFNNEITKIKYFDTNEEMDKYKTDISYRISNRLTTEEK